MTYRQTKEPTKTSGKKSRDRSVEDISCFYSLISAEKRINWETAGWPRMSKIVNFQKSVLLPPTFACVTFMSRHVNTCAPRSRHNIQRPRVCWRGVKLFHWSLAKGEYHLENFSSMAKMTSLYLKDKVAVSHLYMFEFLRKHYQCFMLCFWMNTPTTFILVV